MLLVGIAYNSIYEFREISIEKAEKPLESGLL